MTSDAESTGRVTRSAARLREPTQRRSSRLSNTASVSANGPRKKPASRKKRRYVRRSTVGSTQSSVLASNSATATPENSEPGSASDSDSSKSTATAVLEQPPRKRRGRPPRSTRSQQSSVVGSVSPATTTPVASPSRLSRETSEHTRAPSTPRGSVAATPPRRKSLDTPGKPVESDVDETPKVIDVEGEIVKSNLEKYLSSFKYIDNDEVTPETYDALFEKELPIDIRIDRMKKQGLCSGWTLSTATKGPISGFHIPPATQLSNQKLVTGGSKGQQQQQPQQPQQQQQPQSELDLRNNATSTNALWSYGSTSGSFAYPVFDNHRSHLLREVEHVKGGFVIASRERTRIIKTISRGITKHFQLKQTQEKRSWDEAIKARNKIWRGVVKEFHRRFDLVKKIVGIVRQGIADKESKLESRKSLQKMLQKSEGILRERAIGSSLADSESLHSRKDYTDDGNVTDPRDAEISDSNAYSSDDELDKLEREREMDISEILGEDYLNFKAPTYSDEEDEASDGTDDDGSGEDAEEGDEDGDSENEEEGEDGDKEDGVEQDVYKSEMSILGKSTSEASEALESKEVNVSAGDNATETETEKDTTIEATSDGRVDKLIDVKSVNDAKGKKRQLSEEDPAKLLRGSKRRSRASYVHENGSGCTSREDENEANVSDFEDANDSDDENMKLEEEMGSETDGEAELAELDEDIDIDDLRQKLSNFNEPFTSDEDDSEMQDGDVNSSTIDESMEVDTSLLRESEDKSGIVPDGNALIENYDEIPVETHAQKGESKPATEPEKPAGSANVDEGSQITTRVPFLIRGTLREYQHIGLDWLAKLYDAGLNGILADEMGLGKTIQTISLLAWLAVERENWGPHLIVVPSSVLLNWEMEFKRWLPGFKITALYGSAEERQRRRMGWNKDNAMHVCITSYQIILKDQSIFKRKRWSYLILDEAHNIKNFKSQRWRVLLTLQTSNRLLLTGTPLQNDLMELWSLLYFLMPATIGGDKGSQVGFASHDDFKMWFAGSMEKMMGDGVLVPNMSASDQVDDETKNNVSRLHTLLRPYILRRLKKDVEKQMPAKYEHVLLCKLSKRQRFLYDDFMSRAKTRESLASGNYMAVANVLMQCRKVCNHPDLFEERDIVTGLCFSPGGVVIDNYQQNLKVYHTLWKRLEAPAFIAARKSSILKIIDFDREGKISDYANESLMKSSPINQLRAAIQVVNEKVVNSRQLLPNSQLKYRTLREWHAVKSYRNLLEERERLQKRESDESLLLLKDYCKPVFSEGCIKSVSFIQTCSWTQNIDRFRRDPRNYWRYADHVSAAVLSSSERCEQMDDIVTKFVFVAPKVRLAQFPEGVLPEWYVLPKDVKPRTLNQVWNANHESMEDVDKMLYKVLRQKQLQFPEKRLLQYDCGKLQKLDQLLRYLREGGHKALIFTQMTKMLDILEAFLNIHGYRYLRLDGSTKIEQRQAMMERFNSDPKIFVFILSTRSGGVGMNLTGADSVIFYDSDWNPAMDAQAQDRAHRIGQTREVHIYRLVSQGTVEENILRKANQKRRLEHFAITAGGFRHLDTSAGQTLDLYSEEISSTDGQAKASSGGLSWRDWLDDDGKKLGGLVVGGGGKQIEVADQGAWKAAIAQVEDAADVEAEKLVSKEVEETITEEKNEETIVAGPATPGGAASEAGTLTSYNPKGYIPVTRATNKDMLDQSSRFDYEYFVQMHLDERRVKNEPGGLAPPEGSLDEYMFRQVINEFDLAEAIDWKVFAHELQVVIKLEEAFNSTK